MFHLWFTYLYSIVIVIYFHWWMMFDWAISIFICLFINPNLSFHHHQPIIGVCSVRWVCVRWWWWAGSKKCSVVCGRTGVWGKKGRQVWGEGVGQREGVVGGGEVREEERAGRKGKAKRGEEGILSHDYPSMHYLFIYQLPLHLFCFSLHLFIDLFMPAPLRHLRRLFDAPLFIRIMIIFAAFHYYIAIIFTPCITLRLPLRRCHFQIQLRFLSFAARCQLPAFMLQVRPVSTEKSAVSERCVCEMRCV